MIRPDDLSPEHESRVRALLDAFAGANSGAGLFIHESSCAHVGYIVATWAKEHGLQISTTTQCRCDTGAYETWTIVAGGTIHAFPGKIGMLDGADKLAERIKEIEKAAASQIEALRQQVKAVTP